jgi:hypothetical protein
MYTQILVYVPAAIAGPSVLAGFIDAPVDIPEARALIITAAPAPTAISSFTCTDLAYQVC